MPTWTRDDIPWDRFDPSKVDPDILKVVKAASMLERNGRDYARYLCGVFRDDPEFQKLALEWAEEEVQHGMVLAEWAALADPSFDFEASFRAFSETIKLPAAAERSVRGSRTGELIARCMIEIGTSSYYSALAAASEEPVLKNICRHIAADELRHYKLFYRNVKRYRDRDRVNLARRVWVLLSRIGETSDDELAYAYYTANHKGEAYDRKKFRDAYASRAFRYYQPHHIERAVAMALKAVGLAPNRWLGKWLSRFAYRLLDTLRRHRMRAAVI